MEEGLETKVWVHEIANTDTKITVDVYTRNPRNARQALEDLREAIDDLLYEWKTGKYFQLPAIVTDGSEQPEPTFLHYRRQRDLHIIRPPAA